MKLVLFTLLFFFATYTSAYSQEEGGFNYGASVATTTPSPAVEIALERAREAAALYLYQESRAQLVAPRICTRREIEIPTTVTHPRAGMILRIENGECLLPNPYYVHNPRTHRIYIIGEAEAITILESIVTLMQQSASE